MRQWHIVGIAWIGVVASIWQTNQACAFLIEKRSITIRRASYQHSHPVSKLLFQQDADRRTWTTINPKSYQTTSVVLGGTRNIVDDTQQTEKERSIQRDDDDESPDNKQHGDDSFVPRAFEKDFTAKDLGGAIDSHHYESLPFSLIVNQLLIKQALVIAATDPSLGVVLYGPKGTCKSVLARALHHLLPKEEATTATPLVRVPLHCQEDALLGTVDLERSLETGQTIFEPGLLHACHEGLLIVDDLQLLDEELSNMLLNAVQDGQVTVEREGLSARYPCRPLLIATMNPEEGEVRSLDRIAMALPVQPSLSVPERTQVVQHVEGFLDKTLNLVEATKEDEDLRSSIRTARYLLPHVQISREQIRHLCEEATRADCEGQRAELYATKIAKAAAALQGRTDVQKRDLEMGVFLSIVPRARSAAYLPSSITEQRDQQQQHEQDPTTDDQTEPPPPPTDELTPLSSDNTMLPPPPPPQEEKEEETDPSSQDQQMEEDEQPQEEKEELDLDDMLMIPEQFMFGVDTTSIDPRLLIFQQWSRKGLGGKRARMFNLKRGRFVKAIFPKGSPQGRSIAVGATLRAASPFQKSRREKHHHETITDDEMPTPTTKAAQRRRDPLVYIDEDDIRIKRLKRKSGTLVMFVVDASGSMALNRMGAAKGAAATLLQEAYKSRDKICLVAFHDNKAEVLVPPTKSIALTSARQEQMPCGGRSPLAHAMAVAMRTGLNAIKVKKDVGKVIMVLITDGRPTVPLCVSEGEELDAKLMDPHSKDGKPSRPFCRNEVLAIAKQLGAVKDDLHLLVIDTEDKFVSTGVASEIARLAQGNYYALSGTDVADLTAITRKHMEQSQVTASSSA